ncbi:MAG: aminotransferase class I/II-fold pyridoxal phosphate-dependent enzyme [Candidatus Aminicenantes bacterium]
MSAITRKLSTRLVHAGDPIPRIKGAVNIPVFQTAMYEYGEGDKNSEIKYIRLSNSPNHRALHAKLAQVEEAEDALVAASGMAAISTALLTVLSSGDHLLAQDCLYGGTLGFISHELPSLGIEYDLIGGNDPESWEKKLKPRTKAVYVETLTNPLLEMADLEAIVKFAQKHGLVTIIDNTFATPVNFRPSRLGFDLSVHSCTKYLNGHSDIVGGALTGSREWIDKIKPKLSRFGGSMDPHVCFLLHRGMKTLSLRVERQNDSALKIARFLKDHLKVKTVNYPGLKSHPQHQRAGRLLKGFGGMISFELTEGLAAAARFLRKAEIPITAPSLGGVETLITRPALTSHSWLTPEERQKAGIPESLIRISVGIEDIQDLISDFHQALE